MVTIVQAGKDVKLCLAQRLKCSKVAISCTSMATLGKWQKINPKMMTRKIMANLSSAFRLFSLAVLFVLSSSHFWDFLSEDLEKKKKRSKFLQCITNNFPGDFKPTSLHQKYLRTLFLIKWPTRQNISKLSILFEYENISGYILYQ